LFELCGKTVRQNIGVSGSPSSPATPAALTPMILQDDKISN